MKKNRTKKQFIAETNNNLTAEECKEYYDNFSVRGWKGEYVDVEGYVQSWEEIKNISDTNSFDVSI